MSSFENAQALKEKRRQSNDTWKTAVIFRHIFRETLDALVRLGGITKA